MSKRNLAARKLFAVALAAGAAFAPTVVAAQAPKSGAFVVTLGADTETVEQFTRNGNVVTGEIVAREPSTTIVRYTLTLGANGMPATFKFTRTRADGSPVPAGARSGTMTFGPDTAVSEVMSDTAITRKAAAAHALPYLGYAYSVYQYAIDAMKAAHLDSLDVSLVPPGSLQRYPFPFLRRDDHTYTVYFFNEARYPQAVTLDAAGAITMVDGRQTTEKVVARRVKSVNIGMLAAAFARSDRAGRSMGIASPRDTVTAVVGAAHLWLDYSRPSVRGRTVFGANGVLGDTLWRTGANAATQFKTDVDLDFNGQTLPAGTYSVWTSAHPGHYELIFNKQIGQWGTEYDPRQDLFRVPVGEATLPSVVERFTIGIEGKGAAAGAIKLAWDRTELSIPFTVK